MEDGIHELTAAYALDALDVNERAAYEAHVPGCDRCREELAAFWETTEALAVATTGPEPRAELRGRILDAARAEGQNVVPFEPLNRRLVPALGAVAAIAAVAAVGVGIYAVNVSTDLDAARSALVATEQAQAVLADPGSQRVGLESGEGQLFVGRHGDAVLVLDMIDPAPSGRTYEAWIIEDDKAQRAGLFAGTDDRDVVLLDGIVKPGALVAVTVEPAGGVDVATTEPIVVSDHA